MRARPFTRNAVKRPPARRTRSVRSAVVGHQKRLSGRDAAATLRDDKGAKAWKTHSPKDNGSTGRSLTSNNGAYSLGLKDDGNLVLA